MLCTTYFLEQEGTCWKYGLKKGLLSKEKVRQIYSRINQFRVPADVGRVPSISFGVKKIHVPAGIRTKDLLNTSQTLLPTEPLGLWNRSGRSWV